MSSQLQVTGEAKIRDIQGPVVANSGVVTALDGAASQYVRGDGTLADFPTSSGGGSSVSYYLNSSVSQGTIGGVAYRELSKDPIIGAGTDIAISTTGYVASYITDANDPDVTIVPGGNFNCEFYFSVDSNSNNPTTYAELYKYDGTTFTLLGTSAGVPESINQGTTIAPYYFAIPVATAALALTDRLAIRIYVNVDGRTVTLHTENGHLCQVVTTLSKGMVSLNNLTDQSQFLTTGTSGTNFAIASTGDTHTFNLPVASATNTGKLSSTDWSTFNNKQNTITDPITGTGASTQIAYFNSGTSITSEAAFNYDASTNRLGVNTTVPNATIGANAATDSGYSLLLKNDNANYNSIGFATDSTYGNMITADRLGAAPSRNLTLYNYAGFVSITEAGNLGIGLLTPNTGIDIYNGTTSSLWLHTANSGVTGTDGVRLALFSNNGAVLRNNEGTLSMSSEGDFYVITLGAENIRVNSVDGKVGIGNPATVAEMLTVNGSIQQSGVLSSLLKTNGDGKLIAAVAGTDYVVPSALSGYVPTSRTITINGTTQDLSANISYSVGTMGGSGVAGRVAYYNGTNSITSEAAFNYDDNLNRFGVNTNSPNATIGANANLDSGYSLLLKNSDTNYSGIGFATSSVYGNTIETVRIGSAPSRNLTLYNYAGYVSLTEAGNLGVGILTPNTGIDIYHSTISSLWLHTASSGTSGTDGVRLFLSSNSNAVLRNNEGSLSMSSESDFYVITLGAENIRVNSANGYVGIGNPATLPSMLTVNGGATITALTTGQIVFPTSGGTLSGSNNLFWDNATDSLRIGTNTNGNRRLTIYSSSDAQHLSLIANVPAITFGSDFSYSYYAGIGMATANNNFVTGTVLGDLTIGAYNTNNIYFYNANTNSIRMLLGGSGDAIFSGSVTARGPKSQIIVDGNSVGCGISLTNTIVGSDRRNWGIFTEQNVNGDFVINRSNSAGGSASSGTTILSILNTGAATFSSSVTATQLNATTTAAGYASILTNTNGASDSNGLLVKAGSTSSEYVVRFAPQSDASTFFTVKGNGNVGIGTTTTTNGLLSLRANPGDTVALVFQPTGSQAPSAISNFLGTNQTFTLLGSNAYVTGAGNIARFNTSYAGCFIALDEGELSFATGTNGVNPGQKMRISTLGKVTINPTIAGDDIFNVTNTSSTGYGASIQGGSSSSNYSLVVRGYAGSEYFKVRGDGLIFMLGSYPFTTGASANMVIFSDGSVGRSTSSLKYKKNVQNYTKGLAQVMQLRAVTYQGKSNIDNEKTFAGLIAEEVHELGLTEFVQYAEDGTPDALAYQNMIALAFKAIQELKLEIDELKNK